MLGESSQSEDWKSKRTDSKNPGCEGSGQSGGRVEWVNCTQTPHSSWHCCFLRNTGQQCPGRCACSTDCSPTRRQTAGMRQEPGVSCTGGRVTEARGGDWDGPGGDRLETENQKAFVLSLMRRQMATDRALSNVRVCTDGLTHVTSCTIGREAQRQ